MGEADGQKTLFAYSPVGAATRYAVVFSWPWRTLTANVERQGVTLGGDLGLRRGGGLNRGRVAVGLPDAPAARSLLRTFRVHCGQLMFAVRGAGKLGTILFPVLTGSRLQPILE